MRRPIEPSSPGKRTLAEIYKLAIQNGCSFVLPGKMAELIDRFARCHEWKEWIKVAQPGGWQHHLRHSHSGLAQMDTERWSTPSVLMNHAVGVGEHGPVRGVMRAKQWLDSKEGRGRLKIYITGSKPILGVGICCNPHIGQKGMARLVNWENDVPFDYVQDVLEPGFTFEPFPRPKPESYLEFFLYDGFVTYRDQFNRTNKTRIPKTWGRVAPCIYLQEGSSVRIVNDIPFPFVPPLEDTPSLGTNQDLIYPPIPLNEDASMDSGASATNLKLGEEPKNSS